MSGFVRVRRTEGQELTIILAELEDALQGMPPGEHYLLLQSGRMIVTPSEEELEEMGEESDAVIADDEEAIPIDEIETRVRFRWMEDFIFTVHSIAAQNALRDALRHKKPFRSFQDALTEFPVLRQKWFEFEGMKLRDEAAHLLENLDYQILEIVDPMPVRSATEEIDPAANVPLTDEEHEIILRGAWQIAAKGGRSQLSLTEGIEGQIGAEAWAGSVAHLRQALVSDDRGNRKSNRPAHSKRRASHRVLVGGGYTTQFVMAASFPGQIARPYSFLFSGWHSRGSRTSIIEWAKGQWRLEAIVAYQGSRTPILEDKSNYDSSSASASCASASCA